jgi:hypothetical protein
MNLVFPTIAVLASWLCISATLIGLVRGRYHSSSGSWIGPWTLRSFEFARGEVVIPTALILVGLLLLVGFSSREGGLAYALGFGWLGVVLPPWLRQLVAEMIEARYRKPTEAESTH